MFDNYLAHHGIKGMRWGVRKQYVHTGFGARRKVKTNSRSMSEEEAKKARKRQIAKRVAIGLGATAAIVGTGYAVHRAKENRKKEISAFENVVKKTVSNTKPMDSKEKKTYETINKQWNNYTDKQKASLAKNSNYGNFNKAKTFQKIASNPKIKDVKTNTLRAVKVDRHGKQTEYNIEDYTQELINLNAKKLRKLGLL